MSIFPLAPDQTIAQMWSNGAWGGGFLKMEATIMKAEDSEIKAVLNERLVATEVWQ